MPRTYRTQLKKIEDSHPRLTSHLSLAEKNRTDRIASYASGARLRGIEELLGYLEQVQVIYGTHHLLSRIAFLIHRSRQTLVTSIEAGLSGYHSVAIDSMRTVMEVEFLLRDFRFNKGNLEAWLSADPQTQSQKFGPNALRQRHAQRIGVPVQDLPESSDYKMHSRVLHVSTTKDPFGGVPGLEEPSAPFGDDSFFWEFFEHSRRLLIQIVGLKRRRAPRLNLDDPFEDGNLELFWDAWQRTQEMLYMSFSIVKFANESPSDR